MEKCERLKLLILGPDSADYAKVIYYYYYYCTHLYRHLKHVQCSAFNKKIMRCALNT